MRKAWLLASLSLALVTAAQAQDNPSSTQGSPTPTATPTPAPVTRLSLNLTDGSRVNGVPSIHALGMVTDYATLSLQVSAIRNIKLSGSDSAATTKLANGDLLTGHLDAKDFKIETIFGPVDIPITVIREIQASTSGSSNLPDGLILHYKFSGGGDAIDQSPTGADGKVHGATYSAEGKPGMVFNGNQQFIELGNPEALHVQDFTIAAWVKRNTIDRSPMRGGSDALLVGFGSRGYCLGLSPNGQLLLTKVDESNTRTDCTISDQDFHHIAVTKQGSRIVFYLDGTAFPCSQGYETQFEFNTSFGIGARADTQQCSFIGVIGELEVFNRPLTGDEIKGIYGSQK